MSKMVDHTTAIHPLVGGSDRWNDATDAQKLEFCRAVVEKWRERFALTNWRLHIQLEKQQDEAGSRCAAEVRAVDHYLQALIQVYPRLWHHGYCDTEREFELVHELVHALLDPLKRLVEEQRAGKTVSLGELERVSERVTSTITSITWRPYEGRIPDTTDIA